MTKTYELMVLVRPDFDVSDTKKATELVKKLVGDERAILKDVTNLGKKQLAYPIQKLTEAVYLVATVHANSLTVGDLQKRAALGGDVVRFLLTVKEG